MKNRSDNAEGIFLEFLKDPLADDSLRIAVIKLISASIYQQTSMLTTFFDESNSSQPSKNTIVPFLITFLDDIKKVRTLIVYNVHNILFNCSMLNILGSKCIDGSSSHCILRLIALFMENE